MRKMISVLCVLCVYACGINDPVTSEVAQEEICLTCEGGEGDTGWTPISVDSEEAQPASDQLTSAYGVYAVECSAYTGNGPTGGPVACISCRGPARPGCGYHNGGCYDFCRVCVGDVRADDNICAVGSVLR